MAGAITVRDLSKARSIVEAFQAALDGVYNPRTIREFGAGRIVGRLGQAVRPAPEEPTLGFATIVFGGGESARSMIIVTMYACGYHASPTALYVQPRLICALTVGVPRTELKAPFVFNEVAREYRAQIVISHAVVRTRSRAVIRVQK